MCGCFAGQFSRENRRDIYMQLPDVYCNLHSSLRIVNGVVFFRLHLLRRRGTHLNDAPQKQTVYWSPDLRSGSSVGEEPVSTVPKRAVAGLCYHLQHRTRLHAKVRAT